ncbi:hypothetical protein [Cellulosimicrobium protaetiae]
MRPGRQTRGTIEQAKGVIMLAVGVGADEAHRRGRAPRRRGVRRGRRRDVTRAFTCPARPRTAPTPRARGAAAPRPRAGSRPGAARLSR